jgi:hypothetical protein
VVVLAALAIFALGLAALGSWERVAGDKEQELLRAGSAYVRAIGAYYQRSPGTQALPDPFGGIAGRPALPRHRASPAAAARDPWTMVLSGDW